MQITVDIRDQALTRFGNRLASLGESAGRIVLMRALNHEGNKLRTPIKKALRDQTGIKYNQIGKAVRTIEATTSSLTYTLEARGDETNINLFGARQGKRGVSAAPWNQRRVFKHSFKVEAYSGKVYIRKTKARFPLRQVFGPNIARELVKGQTAEAFRAGMPGISDRVGHEIDHYLRGG